MVYTPVVGSPTDKVKPYKKVGSLMFNMLIPRKTFRTVPQYWPRGLPFYVKKYIK